MYSKTTDLKTKINFFLVDLYCPAINGNTICQPYVEQNKKQKKEDKKI